MSEGQSLPPSAEPEELSPSWGTNTKLIIGIALLAIAAGMLVQFRPLFTPLAFAVVLSYLLYPVVEWLSQKTFFSWRGATNLVFFVLLILGLSSLTASGFALVNQFENLIKIIQTFLNELPTIIADFLESDPVLVIPFINYTFDLGEYVNDLNIDLLAISDQLLKIVQPVLGQAGSVLTKVATSALTTVGWSGFVLAVAYLTLGESRQGQKFFQRELHQLSNDIGRMTRELSYIWHAFLRGQVLVFMLSSSTMFILMSILGVRYAFGLAILAGFARFVPYVGQYVSAIVNALVAFFLAEGNHFGLEAFPYMALVVGLAFLHDQIYDSLVIPRLIGFVLGVHPALVLVVALIAVRWIGVLGLLLAAPVLSSFQLIFRYVVRKMIDQDPWPDPEVAPPTLQEQFKDIFRTIVKSSRRIWEKITNIFNSIIKRIKRS